MPSNLSHTEENYIKAIYHLEQDGHPVNTNHLSELLKTAAASVTDMLMSYADMVLATVPEAPPTL